MYLEGFSNGRVGPPAISDRTPGAISKHTGRISRISTANHVDVTNTHRTVNRPHGYSRGCSRRLARRPIPFATLLTGFLSSRGSTFISVNHTSSPLKRLPTSSPGLDETRAMASPRNNLNRTKKGRKGHGRDTKTTRGLAAAASESATHQLPGDDLESFGVGAHDQLLLALDGLGVIAECLRQLHLNRSAARHHLSLAIEQRGATINKHTAQLSTL